MKKAGPSERSAPQSVRKVVIKPGLPTIEVVTTIDRPPTEVAELRNALTRGDVGTKRPPLPTGVVEKILETSEYWCSVRKECSESFDAYSDLDFLFFKFGPLPGNAKKIEFQITSHDQGWSSYPEEYGLRSSWTYGELDIKSGLTKSSKLGSRLMVFRNLHAEWKWQDHSQTQILDESFPCEVEKGDTIELYLRALFPLWRMYAKNTRMVVHYEAP